MPNSSYLCVVVFVLGFPTLVRNRRRSRREGLYRAHRCAPRNRFELLLLLTSLKNVLSLSRALSLLLFLNVLGACLPLVSDTGAAECARRRGARQVARQTGSAHPAVSVTLALSCVFSYFVPEMRIAACVDRVCVVFSARKNAEEEQTTQRVKQVS